MLHSVKSVTVFYFVKYNFVELTSSMCMIHGHETNLVQLFILLMPESKL